MMAFKMDMFFLKKCAVFNSRIKSNRVLRRKTTINNFHNSGSNAVAKNNKRTIKFSKKTIAPTPLEKLFL